jgi:hypothetical protein
LRADYEALWQRTEKLRAEHVALRHEAEKLRVDRDSQQHDAKQLRANWDAQWQETVNLRADHDALWHEAARLRTELEGTVADRDSLRPQAEKLDRLVRELRWPGGPRALRITLPVARLIRRLHGTPVPDEALGKIGIAGRSAGPSDPSRAESQQSIAKSGALAIYRPLRPVLRPIAWRVRSFLTAQLGNDLMRIQGELQNLRQELALTETRLRSNIVAGGAGDPVLAELGKFSQALEATLLTLALERESS